MIASTLLYCGADDCRRVPVLSQAGFRVVPCASVAELAQALKETPDVAAILFQEERGNPADAAAELAWKRSSAARVLFQHPSGESSAEKFDLIVAPGTPPSRWRQQLAQLVLSRERFTEFSPSWARIAHKLLKDAPTGNSASASAAPDPRAARIQLPKRRRT
jgi:hypothetical protein